MLKVLPFGPYPVLCRIPSLSWGESHDAQTLTHRAVPLNDEVLTATISSSEADLAEAPSFLHGCDVHPRQAPGCLRERTQDVFSDDFCACARAVSKVDSFVGRLCSFFLVIIMEWSGVSTK